ncbi:MAG: EAL domain-containing protein [Hydrogenophilaceae bacterium]|nr:EAL domain-containing protein [Hydrogenophilaceae bacterium]
MPESVFQPRTPFRPYLGVVVAVLVGSLLSVLSMLQEQEVEQGHFDRQLEWRASNEAARFQFSLDRSLEVVESLNGLFNSSSVVDRAEFERFVAGPLSAHPEFQALQWLPRISQAERADVERELSRVKPGTRLTERSPSGVLVPAAEREEYFPVFYTEPYAANAAALGFNPTTRPEVRQAMEAARDSGAMALTAKLSLVQGGGQRQAVIVFRPIYQSGKPLLTVGQRRTALRGYAASILLVDKILAETQKKPLPTGLDVYIVDRTAGSKLLHVQASRARSVGEPLPLAQVMAGKHWVVPIRVPGRDWQMVFAPTPAFYAEFSATRHYWVLAIGLVLTALFAFDLYRQAATTRKLSVMAQGLAEANAEMDRHSHRLNEAQRLTRVGSWELDLASGQAIWSDQEFRCLGYEPGSVEAKLETLMAAVHPDDRIRVQAVINAARQGHAGPYELVHRVVWPDGSERIVRQRAEVHADKSGMARSMLGTTQDITDSKRLEERLRLAAQVLASTKDGVMITSPQGRIIEVNAAFSKIMGYSAEEVVGQNPRMWKSERHPPQFYQELWASLNRTGHWQGELWNRRKNGEIFPAWQTISAVRNEGGQLTHYVSVFSDISGIVQSQAELAHLAHHDPLTDLPNRLLFLDRLHQALSHAKREQSQLALLFLDLDRFKHINDSLGHLVGDELIQEVAKRLNDTLRQDDTRARMGGDEFILMLENLRNEQDAAHLADKLLQVLAEPYRVRGHELYVTASIGISLYPRDADTPEALVSNADAAMYRAKAAGRNVYSFYTQALTLEAMERVRLESDLRGALERGELVLHYQPQVDLRTGQIIGAEALMRWQHKERGLLMPNRFIPIAEDTGLIIELGEWALRQACGQARQWLDQGALLESIAVNVAGPQIQRSDFVATVRRILEETKLPPDRLELEVTENLIMDQAESTVGVLKQLSDLGVYLSIDDFGTGYSSLAYLKRLPIDRLKIDRSFVRDLPMDEEDAAITRAVIALADSLGLRTIAEGVETEAQVALLQKLGCQQAQGFFYGKPQEPETIVWS